jgi:hypothetical protein
MVGLTALSALMVMAQTGPVVTAQTGPGATAQTGPAARAQTRPVAQPGALNYVEGLVTLNGQPVTRANIGRAELERGQVLATTDGRVEVLLTPGVFLRLDRNSAVRMVSPDLVDTAIEVMNGRAMLEADWVPKETRLEVDTKGAQAVLDKKGLYEVDADKAAVTTYEGKAIVTVAGRRKDVNRDEYLAFENNPKLHTNGVHRNATDSLYAWSKVRSEYMSEMSAESARNVVLAGSPWYGPGWFWNPWYDGWAFLPGDGFLWSPFGFGFWSPMYWGGYYGYGLGGYHGFYGGYRGAYGGFHGGMAGGFHGGGGGGRR